MRTERHPDVVRVANCSGFFGDRFDAPLEMVRGGPIEYLTGDYLAELTMLILWRSQQRGGVGYAHTFLRQMEGVLGECLDRGIKVVTNAGGLAPAELAAHLGDLCDLLGVRPSIAHIEGDDLLPELDELLARGHPFAHIDTGQPLAKADVEPVTANAYLGAWGIVEALRSGADVVVCPRVTDASLAVGPAAHHHGWSRSDWDELAGAVAAGHVIECGAQATGGNYAFFHEVPRLGRPGFPIAEIARNGSAVITKHPDTDGLVSVGTVTAQLLYEIGSPRYLNPDVVAHFDTTQLDQLSPDRVQMSGTRGSPAPADTKVAINYIGGFRNSVTIPLTGLDIDAKIATVREGLNAHFPVEELDAIDFRVTGRDPGSLGEEPDAELTITAKSTDPKLVGRRFSNAVVEMALSNIPGFFTTRPPSDATQYGVYWPALVPAAVVPHRVVIADRTITVGPPTRSEDLVDPPPSEDPPGRGSTFEGPTGLVPLGYVAGARSGDKAGNANVGVWTRDEEAFAWLRSALDVDTFRALLPETGDLAIQRHELPGINALNFVIVGLLGEGVASSTRTDPQAKSLAERLRARTLAVPVALFDGTGAS